VARCKKHKNILAAGTLPQTLLVELTALPEAPSWILGWKGKRGERKRWEGKDRRE